MTGGRRATFAPRAGAEEAGRRSALRVWGSRGKGAALPLASGALDDERSAVGQGACLRCFPTADPVFQRCKDKII